MINVLPPEVKKSYRYASLNVHLLRWVTASALCLVLIGLIGGFGWLSMRREIADNVQQAASLQASLNKAHLTQTNKQIVEISNSLKLAEKVLGQEILFSKLLKQMATVLPNGTYLSGLAISNVTSGSGLDVTVNATNYTTASQVQVNLADPNNQIFAKADIQNVTCDGSNANDPAYPCKITLRAQFAANNPFLFINQKQAKS